MARTMNTFRAKTTSLIITLWIKTRKLLSAWNRGSAHFLLLLYFTYSFTVTAQGDAGKVRSGFDPLCHDNPTINCVFLDHSAQICSAFPKSEETKSYCPRYCGLCGDQTTVRSVLSTVAGSVDHITSRSAGHVTTGGSGHVTGAPAGTTTAPFTGPCVDDPAAKCADLDQTAHICTLYRNDLTTRTSCPKYCGLCGGHVTTGGSGHVTGAPAGTTTAPFTGPCVDDPAAKCADLDQTAHICTLYRNDPTTRTSCPKYCGLCGGHVTTGGSGHVTGAPAGTTTAPFTGPCVDDPAAKCADLDHTAHICTLYRNDPTTRTSCPKYCGLCGDGHVTTGGSGHVTGAPAGTTTAPFTGPCVDDPAAKCADLDHTAHICTLYRNDPTTRTSCPKYCGLCGDGHVTTVGSGHVTATPAGATTAPCVDDPAAKCADLDQTAHICTLYRNDLTTRTNCPKYCGLCGDGKYTGGVVSTNSIHSTREHTTLSHTRPSTTRRATQSTSEAPTTMHLYTEHVTETTSLPTTMVIFKTTGSVYESTIGSETSTNRQTSTQHFSTTEAHGPSTTVSMESVMLEAFHKEDLNKDGRVSFAEFERAWQILDVNGDGRVTEYEYSRGTHFSRLIASEVFSYIDGDHNFVITLQELPHIYTLFDTDYSGSIEREEYIQEYLRIYNHIKNNLQ